MRARGVEETGEAPPYPTDRKGERPPNRGDGENRPRARRGVWYPRTEKRPRPRAHAIAPETQKWPVARPVRWLGKVSHTRSERRTRAHGQRWSTKRTFVLQVNAEKPGENPGFFAVYCKNYARGCKCLGLLCYASQSIASCGTSSKRSAHSSASLSSASSAGVSLV